MFRKQELEKKDNLFFTNSPSSFCCCGSRFFPSNFPPISTDLFWFSLTCFYWCSGQHAWMPARAWGLHPGQILLLSSSAEALSVADSVWPATSPSPSPPSPSSSSSPSVRSLVWALWTTFPACSQALHCPGSLEVSSSNLPEIGCSRLHAQSTASH